MDHSKFSNDDKALIEFLNQNGIPAIASANAHPGLLHWWEFEKVERITDVAIFEGDFFIAVTEQGFSLHVYNAYNDWYNFAKVWNSDVPESEFLRDIKEIIFSDESHIWFCVRETYFEFAWQRTISDIQNIEQISPELKADLFRFEEGLVESPKVRELKQAIVDLLALFTNDDILNPVNCLIMERYFPPSKYERWALPNEFKSLLHELGESFNRNQIPTTKEVGILIEKAKDLRV